IVGSIQADSCLVFHRCQGWVVEGRQEETLEEIGGELPAAAVAEHDLLVTPLWQRTGAEDLSAGGILGGGHRASRGSGDQSFARCRPAHPRQEEFHVLPDILLLLRAAARQEERRMERTQQRDSLVVVEAAAQFTDRSARVEDVLRGGGPKSTEEPRPHQ